MTYKELAEKLDTQEWVIEEMANEIQKLLNTGWWFSDACDVVHFMFDHQSQFKNPKHEYILELYDQLANDCYAPKDVKPFLSQPLW